MVKIRTELVHPAKQDLIIVHDVQQFGLTFLTLEALLSFLSQFLVIPTINMLLKHFIKT